MLQKVTKMNEISAKKLKVKSVHFSEITPKTDLWSQLRCFWANF